MVEFDGVGLRYGPDAEVLCDISFNLQPGSFYFLTGPSGAGKTSLLKMLYLAQRPSRGIVRLFGEDLVHRNRRRHRRATGGEGWPISPGASAAPEGGPASVRTRAPPTTPRAAAPQTAR